MAEQAPPQHYPTNNHHDQGEPSSSSSSAAAPQIGSSLSSSSLPSSAASTQPSPPKYPINAGHYAMLLNNEPIRLRDEINQGSDFYDPSNNTILHLAASVGQLEVIYMIKQQRPSLLTLPNSNGDLPVHVAARACQPQAVDRLVRWAEEVGCVSLVLENKNEENMLCN